MKKRLNCVMLIDDDEDDNYFHQVVLKKMDFANHIEIAEGGPEALDYLKREKDVPDIIFLDINMPGMNGWDFLEEYKKLTASQKKSVIIIMLTTSISPLDKKNAENIPEISSFYSKPMTQEMLLDILDQYFPDEKNGAV
ncbi:MAG: response regulator [Ginsengibacter sp.]